ncbi:hypothetical protein RCL1_004944 [Eukaryota sp. TZLM3-RCL]
MSSPDPPLHVDNDAELVTFAPEEPQTPIQSSPSRSFKESPNLTPNELGALKSVRRSIVRERMNEFSKLTDAIRLGPSESSDAVPVIEEHRKRINWLRQLRNEEKQRRRNRFIEIQKYRESLLKEEEEQEMKRKAEQQRRHEEYLTKIKERIEKAQVDRQARIERQKQAEESYTRVRQSLKQNPPLYQTMLDQFRKYYEAIQEEQRKSALDEIAAVMRTPMDLESLRKASEEISQAVAARTEELARKRQLERSPPKILKNIYRAKIREVVLSQDEEEKTRHLQQLEEARELKQKMKLYAKSVKQQHKPHVSPAKRREMEEMLWKLRNPAPTYQQRLQAPWVQRSTPQAHPPQPLDDTHLGEQNVTLVNPISPENLRLPQLSNTQVTEQQVQEVNRPVINVEQSNKKMEIKRKKDGPKTDKTPRKNKQEKVKKSQRTVSEIADRSSSIINEKPKSEPAPLTNRSSKIKSKITVSTTPTPPQSIIDEVKSIKKQGRKVKDELRALALPADVLKNVEAEAVKTELLMEKITGSLNELKS